MASPPALPPAALARYSRHVRLEQVGVAGQEKLAAARVLVIGAGGLGSPAALYLAAAGVGTLGIADFDRVEVHNLQRQLLHDDRSLGEPKVQSALRRLQSTNPHIRVVPHEGGITPANAVELFSGYDVLVDGTDNFAARYLNGDAAALARRPLVYGSVFKFEGQVSVFDPAQGGPCYRCLFPEPPAPGSVPGCGEAGVLGALCGVIGSLQALEAIKLITGIGDVLRGRLLTYDALRQHFLTLELPRDPHCALCGTAATIHSIDPSRYRAPLPCAPLPPMPDTEVPFEVSVTEAQALQQSAPDRTLIIDVREPHELAICHLPQAEAIPMRQIPERLDTLPRDRHLLILCHAGGRSRRVTEFLRAQGLTAVSNIAGGIDAWATEIDPSLPRY
jgi:molybdopterin/thiamine biosynthesis adenylyltransferase/rhodanese-related sulfurtransferase